VIADITKNDGQRKIKAAIQADVQGLILIHNAGVALPQLLENISEEHWDEHYLTNAKAPIFLTKLLTPFLKNGGRVLNVSTSLAHVSMLAMSAYGVSKAALFHWKEFCNVELKSLGILVGSAKPGIVDTRMQDHLRTCDVKDFPAAGIFKGFYERNELLSPDTVAKFLSWLVLEADGEAFTKGDWDIYDMSHREFWAMPGDIKDRESIKSLTATSQVQLVNLLNNSLFNSIRDSKYLSNVAVSAVSLAAGIIIARTFCK
jgi:benzil reductase ((S)-benzoin forming)